MLKIFRARGVESMASVPVVPARPGDLVVGLDDLPSLAPGAASPGEDFLSEATPNRSIASSVNTATDPTRCFWLASRSSASARRFSEIVASIQSGRFLFLARFSVNGTDRIPQSLNSAFFIMMTDQFVPIVLYLFILKNC